MIVSGQVVAGGLAAVGGIGLFAGQDLTPVEKHAVLWLLSAVVLLIGGGVLKLTYDLHRTISLHAVAMQRLSDDVRQMMQQHAQALSSIDDERTKAVAVLLVELRDVRDTFLRQITLACGGGGKPSA